jgi:hypothetical protein
VQASRLQDGSRRMVSITEITGMEGEIITMQEVFKFERTGIAPDGKIIGHFTGCGIRSHYADRFKRWGYDLPHQIYDVVRTERELMAIDPTLIIYAAVFIGVLLLVEALYLIAFGRRSGWAAG